MLIRSAKQHSAHTSDRSPPGPAREPRAGYARILLVSLTLAALWPVTRNDFTTWDDNLNVWANPRLNPVTPSGLLYFWTHPFKSEYIPLSYTVWGALASIARVGPDADGITLNPAIFHSANLLLHVGSVLLAFELLRRLTHQIWPAAMGALLFALHPMQVEPVAWVTGLKDVLCGFLSLLALWQYVLFAGPIDSDPASRSDRNRLIAYCVATVAFLLAVLAKPSAVTLPLAALLLDRCFLRRPWKQIAKAVAPWLVISAAFCIVALTAHTVLYPADGGKIWVRPFLSGAALAFYLYKLVWPARLALIYRYSVPFLLSGHWIGFAWLVPATLAIVAWVFRKRWPWLGGCLGLIVVATLPVLGLTPFQFEGRSLVADRYFYVAMIGPALALSCGLAAARQPKFAFAICSVYLTALGVRTFLQTASWQDTVSLFTHELAVNPTSGEAYNALSERALARGEPQLAEQLARESIRLQPNQADAYITLGGILDFEGRTQEALPLFLIAYRRDPENMSLLNNLAGLLAAQADGDPQKLAQAEQISRQALQIDPMSALAHGNLSAILSYQGHLPEALREAKTAVQLNPANAPLQTNLADLLEMNHQRDAAIEHAKRALELDPGYTPARDVLAKLNHPAN